ncbi:hypothetical protein H6F92_16925 [Microcystis wesenbergii FACHB-1317]|uniref:hypothetical protein n=1 Tax=Microcystis TaxID=1125 RepID=UPI001680AC52|nr:MULTISPECIES: hypothetical protein [Microcystis]MBD2290375.1 hypothetical protein [Microcystis wesenbergii FACHB-1317]UZO76859.1 hypothetical protein M8120_02005 [Microcystis aeruginosa str. Chao 1910]
MGICYTIAAVFLGMQLAAGENLSAANPDFLRLQKALEQHNFIVKLAPPPVRGAYGLFDSKTRIIWIHPLVFDLGIARPTLIHEAVHAAQLCHGGKTVKALNLAIEPPAMTRRFFMNYQGFSRQIEAEAYTVQVQPDGLDLVISLLQKYCP